MQIEIKPFKVKRWMVAAVGMGLFVFGLSLVGQFPLGLCLVGGLLVLGATANWMAENG